MSACISTRRYPQRVRMCQCDIKINKQINTIKSSSDKRDLQLFKVNWLQRSRYVQHLVALRRRVHELRRRVQGLIQTPAISMKVYRRQLVTALMLCEPMMPTVRKSSASSVSVQSHPSGPSNHQSVSNVTPQTFPQSLLNIHEPCHKTSFERP